MTSAPMKSSVITAVRSATFNYSLIFPTCYVSAQRNPEDHIATHRTVCRRNTVRRPSSTPWWSWHDCILLRQIQQEPIR